MARKIVSEYGAKKLLLGDTYQGVQIVEDTDLSTIDFRNSKLWVLKVDDGSKKRFKNGLVKIAVPVTEVVSEINSFFKSGHKNLLVEPHVSHDNNTEQYISFSLIRDGIRIIHSDSGGINVESKDNHSNQFLISISNAKSNFVPEELSHLTSLICDVYSFLFKYQVSFLEINPFVSQGDNFHILDLALEIDSARQNQWPAWLKSQIINYQKQIEQEKLVAELDEQSSASFNLKVLNQNGSIFTLLSGGGASLVVLDTFVSNGLQTEIANYAEYSGGPTLEETKRFAEQVLKLLFSSSANKKVLLIAGGIANFTSIVETFKGIIEACHPHINTLKNEKVLVLVRRGGPGQVEAFKLLENFFDTHNILFKLYDSNTSLAQLADDSTQYLNQK